MNGITRRAALRTLAGVALVGCDRAAPSATVPTGSTTMSTFKLDAKPEAVTLDPKKTAVVVVDMQNDFASKGGMFDRFGFDLTPIQNVAKNIARVLGVARKANLPIVYLKMAFRPDLSDLGAPGSPNREGHIRAGAGNPVKAPDGREGRVLIRDTWNTEVIPELAPAPADIQIYKNRFSGFYQTELEAILKKRGVSTLVFTGCTTSVCVESTLRDATFCDFSVVLLGDCSAEPVGADLSRSNHDATLLVVEQRFGSVSTSEAFLKALG